MALKKSITWKPSPFGEEIIAEYWTAFKEPDKREKVTNVRLSLYKDEATYRDTEFPTSELTAVMFRVPGYDATLPDIYPFIKQNSELFADAEDC